MQADQDRELGGQALMSTKTAQALEIRATLQLISAFAATDLGVAAVRTLAPLSDASGLEHERALLEELGRLLQEAGSLLASSEVGFADPLDRLQRGRGIGTDQLLGLASLLEAFDSAIQRLGSESTPQLFSLLREVLSETSRASDPAEDVEFADALKDTAELARRVRAVLDSKGSVRPDASPELASLIAGARRTRESLYSNFQDFARKNDSVLGDDTVTRAQGRLALLLPAGHRGRLDGIVHGRSGTERSYYFEPLELVEENNKLQEQQSREQAERERLLVELASAFEAHAPLIGRVGVFVATLDRLQAAVRFGSDVGGRFCQLEAEGETWEVHGARHPLLDQRLAGLREHQLGSRGHSGDVVPLDVDSKSDRVLVITGPNAGGKTVALKTLGVLSYLASCGWPIPLNAEPRSRMPLFRSWIAVVGDEQDVLNEQSTFSARLERLREVWETAEAGTLVLLDEVGSGTNPEEGAALSIALLERLIERGCFAVMTTHLLQVANAALDLDGCASLAMELDAETGAPTFQVRAGAPGSSHALDLARRLGLAPEWIARAEQLLGAEQMTLRHLIAETERSRQAALSIEEELRALTLNQETLQRRQDEELLKARDERLAARKKVTGELERFRRTARDELTAELRRSRSKAKATSGGSTKTASKEAARKVAELIDRTEIADLVSSDDTEAEATESAEAAKKVLEAGDDVRHRLLGWRGKIDKLVTAKGVAKADVLVRGKRMRCALDELISDGAAAAKKKAKPRFGATKSTVAVNASKADVGAELMLVGQRVDPALDRLDSYLDQAVVANLDQVRVVHGFGSGQLMKAVRDHLHGHPMVAKFEPAPREQGGGGATVVVLRTD